MNVRTSQRNRMRLLRRADQPSYALNALLLLGIAILLLLLAQPHDCELEQNCIERSGSYRLKLTTFLLLFLGGVAQSQSVCVFTIAGRQR